MRLVLAFAFILTLVNAVYEDEAGKTDVYVPVLGCPQQVFFHSPVSGKGSLCYAFTSSNVLAALSCRTGDVLWRQSFEAEILAVMPVGEVLVTLSKHGAITAWSLQDGSALWLAQSPEAMVTGTIAASTSMSTVFVSAGNSVSAYNVADGTLLWSTKTKLPDSIISSDESSVFTVSKDDGSNGLLISSLDALSGKSLHESSVATDVNFSADQLYVSLSSACPAIIYKSSQKNDIVVRLLSNDMTAILKTEQSYTSFSAQADCLAGKTIVLVSFYGADGTTWAEVYTLISATAIIENTYHIPATRISNAFTLTRSATAVYIVRTSADSSTGQIEIWSAESHGRLSTYEVSLNQSSIGHLTAISAEISEAQSTSEVLVRVMLSTSDCAFHMWRGSSVDWSRPEGLSKVKKVILVALPERQGAEVIAHVTGNLMTDFLDRLRRHTAKLVSLLGSKSLAMRSTDAMPARDKFGLRQYAILASPAEIFAIDTMGSKHVVWQRSLSQAGVTLLDMWQRDSADTQLVVDPIITLLVKSSEGTIEMMLNAMTGALESSEKTTMTADVPMSSSRSRSDRSNSSVSVAVGSSTVKGTFVSFGDSFEWEFEVPQGHHIVAEAVTRSEQQIASVGRVLGDRGVLYKYLEQIVSVIAVNELTGSLSTFVLGAQDGKILHQATHLEVGVNKPVNLVLSDNWFAYHFWVGGEVNAYQMVITELYQGERNVRREAHTDSLHALSQSFIYDYEVEAMTVTTSKQGITSREIVVALKSGQITTIPKRLLDPRRPTSTKLSAADKEELLIPYNAVIAADSRAVLSHKLEVLGVKDIVAAPTLLESTGLICAYGLDVFITRVTPSMPYDILSESFSKAQIVLSLTLLLVAIVVTRPMAAQKTLKKRWIG